MKSKTDTSLVLRRIKDSFRVTRVSCSRVVKTPKGDTYVSMAGSFQTLSQEDPQEVESLQPQPSSLSLTEAVVAAHLLAAQVDRTCEQHAFANGSKSKESADRAIAVIDANFGTLLAMQMANPDFEKS